jgi:hypothetical protein
VSSDHEERSRRWSHSWLGYWGGHRRVRRVGRTGGDAQCVEVAFLSGHRLVRDSKLGDASPVLAVSPIEWSVFTVVVKAGRRDS